MHSRDNASRVGMVIFLLIATVLYVREEAWTEHSARARATVIENTSWYGGRLWNRSPMTLTDVQFLSTGNLINSKLRSWTHRYRVGEILEIAYEPAETLWVYPTPTPLLERSSMIMASIGGFLGILTIIESSGRRQRVRVRDYLKTCGVSEREAWNLTGSIEGQSDDQHSVGPSPLIAEQTVANEAKPTHHTNTLPD